MNALHPPPAPDLAVETWPEAARILRLLRRLAILYGLAVLAVAGLLLVRTAPSLTEVRVGGLGGLVLGSLLLPLTGLLATLPVTWARWRLGQAAGPVAPASLGWGRLRWRRPSGLAAADPAWRLALMARRPQGIIVPAVALLAGAAAWWLRPGAAGASADAVLLGADAVVLTFPLLVAERVMAAVPKARLPEAASLQALLFVPVAIIPVAGVLELAAGLGAAWARPAMVVLALYVCLVAAELAVRALANWFLPPPAPAAARAAVASVAALLLQPGRVAPDGLAAPLRTHLGLDFSRSWALRYARSAFLPVGLLIALAAWGLSGVSLINLDQRGVYERLGAPVAVWQPGAHLGLPWPLGRVRTVELGVVHATALGRQEAADPPSPAEAAAPASADRLWEGTHPAEVSYVIAGIETSGAQSFQSVSVDLKVLYRTGLDDGSALRAAYAVAAPDALVRAEAGRLLARFFAGQVLAAVLGENREQLADGLRASLQAELDRLGSGIELMAMVVEAIHPPAAAAEAYHNVQAAEIVANTAIATERGRAQATAAMARQTAAEGVNTARGTAADTVGAASVLLRGFTADQAAAAAGGKAFLLERYFANLSTALSKAPLVILDHRLNGVEAPVIDLRSFGAPGGRTADDD